MNSPLPLQPDEQHTDTVAQPANNLAPAATAAVISTANCKRWSL